MKLLINRCFGGWSISDEACEWLIANKGWKVTDYGPDGNIAKGDFSELVRSERPYWGKYHLHRKGIMKSKNSVFRDDVGIRLNPDLIDCFEALGAKKFSGRHAEIWLVEVPDDVKVTIEEYDGNEHVAEVHRTW